MSRVIEQTHRIRPAGAQRPAELGDGGLHTGLIGVGQLGDPKAQAGQRRRDQFRVVDGIRQPGDRTVAAIANDQRDARFGHGLPHATAQHDAGERPESP